MSVQLVERIQMVEESEDVLDSDIWREQGSGLEHLCHDFDGHILKVADIIVKVFVQTSEKIFTGCPLVIPVPHHVSCGRIEKDSQTSVHRRIEDKRSVIGRHADSIEIVNNDIMCVLAFFYMRFKMLNSRCLCQKS